MDSRKVVMNETAVIAVGELVCSGVMVGVFAALGHFDLTVLWSALAGCGIVIANYFFLAVVVSLAADKAESGEVERAKKMVQTSSMVRLLCLGIALFLCIWLGANVIALALPLVFMRPILMVAEFFGKKGDNGRN